MNSSFDVFEHSTSWTVLRGVFFFEYTLPSPSRLITVLHNLPEFF